MHRNIKLLLGASILIHAGTNLLAPIFAIYIKEIGGNLLDAGIAMGIYALLKGGFYFLFDKINETTINRKVRIVAGYWLMASGYLLYLYASTPVHVFFIQALLSLGETVINPSWSAVIATSLTRGRESHIYAHFYGYRSLFEGLAAIAGGLFASVLGFNTVFGLMTALAFASGLLACFIRD